MLLGNGLGGFGAASNFPVSEQTLTPRSVTVADFNRDMKPDLAFADRLGVSVLLGDGLGGFGKANTYFVGTATGSAAIAVGDFNGDMKPDLAVASDISFSVLLGNGSGGFGADNIILRTADNQILRAVAPVSVAVGEFNGDMKPDLAVVDIVAPGVGVLLNQWP